MKRPLLIIATVLSVCASYLACNEHDTIYFADLPDVAQAFLQKYFPDNLVSWAERHHDEPKYEVTLDNGYEIDFYSDGSWQEIDSHNAILPSEVVQGVLPEKIRNYLAEEYPLAGVSNIEKSSMGYIVDLATSPITELYFDMDGDVMIYWDE